MSARATTLLLLSLLAPCASIAQETPGQPASPCKDWKAWHNLQSGTTPATLHVTATCQFPTSGYSVELVPVTPKGQGSKAYVLRKVVHKPDGMAAQVITDVPVPYTIETATEYKEVTIKPDKVRVPVEKVY
jgi:ribulose bisphosphate carboxylase small subunit